VTGVSTTEGEAQPSIVVPPRGAAIEVNNTQGNQAFAFAATELATGRVINGLDLVDGGPVVITFLVPQCPVCVTAGPGLAASAAENPEINYVFVHSGGTAETYETYLERSGFETTMSAASNIVHLDDSPGLLWARFGVIQQPTNVLIDAEGSVTQSLGALSASDLKEVTSRLLAT